MDGWMGEWMVCVRVHMCASIIICNLRLQMFISIYYFFAFL